jgi:putative addiction module component (TIGR02574 family)
LRQIAIDHILMNMSTELSALESGAVDITPGQRAELDRRIEEYKKDPTGNIPWETIKAEALRIRSSFQDPTISF